ncbi:hypothetical protein PR202_gb24532 [Eleusine coracana subsp. coracana]|uniref:Zinc finger PHD-type domain-containing protein n=1 Tax=Eleusine coracana subsp. coracana TaxID=191504 RepID=A0AAV5FJ95_ELECO|nr:hypothetical protein PR202_gb24532 [Eleusine coracana subsp. coracana]
MSKHPKINIAIAKAISAARISKNNANSSGSAEPCHHLQNGDSPEVVEVPRVTANREGEVNIPFFPLNRSGKTKRQFEPQGDSVSFRLAHSSSSISPSALNPTNIDLPPTAMVDLPCDCDDACMTCHATPPPMDELLMCFTCFTLWHVPCLSRRPCVAGKRRWTCPDCPGDGDDTAVLPAPSARGDLVAGSHTIEANQGLPERKKQRHMELLAGSRSPPTNEKDDETGRETLREY